MPADPRYTNPFDEVRNIEAFMLRNRAASAIVQRFTPTSAALYANYARDYPWMQPGVIRAASQAGYYPNNPDMIRLATTSLAEGVASGRLNNGQRTRANNMNPGPSSTQTIASDRLPANRQMPVGQEDPFAEYVAAGMIDEEGNLVRPAAPKYKGRENGKPVWDYDDPGDKEADQKFTRLLRLISEQEGSLKPIPYQLNNEWRQWHPRTGNSETINRPRSDINAALAAAPINRAGSVPILGEAVRGIQSVVEPAYQAAQPVIRTAGAVANYPIQEFQQVGRNINLAVQQVQRDGFGALLEKPPEEMQFGGESTDIGIMGEQLLGGEKVDAGSGFFVSPTSEVARERVRREAEAGTIGGHNITWGRWAASALSDPDTVPFDVMSGFVDFSIQIADPTAAGLGQSGRARQAARLFEADEVANPSTPHLLAGILGTRGRKPTVDFNTAQKYFDSDIGVRAVDDLAATSSAYQVGKKLNSGKLEFKHDPALYKLLADHDDPVAVRSILNDAIRTGQVRETADLTKSWGHGLGTMVRNRMPRSRLMDKMPGHGVHLSDPVEVTNSIMRSYRNVNAPEQAIEEAVNKLATATTRHGRRNAVMQVFGSGPNSILAHHGVDPEVADELTRLYQSSFNEMWRGIVDELGSEVPTWEHTLLNGEKTLVGGPHALIELIEDYMPLPDARALRELTRKFPSLIGKIPEGNARVIAEMPGAAIEYLLQDIWKPMALFRGAWLVRVLGEGQMRIAADGLDSLFSGHPIEALGFMMSKKRIPTGKIPGLSDIEPRVPISFMDDKWDEVHQYENSISSIANWAHRPGGQSTTTKTDLIRKGQHADKEYRHAWARQLMKFNYDPIYSKWMETNSIDEMTEWLTKGKGRKHLREYQEAFPGNMETPEQVRKFLDDIELRFNIMTKGNTDLFDILRSGEWTDDAGKVHSIYKRGKTSGSAELNPQFTALLRNHMDDGPDVVVRRGMSATRGKSDYPTLRKYAVQNFLYGAMSRSENLLARAPVFKQAYGKEMAEMVQFGTAKARTQVIAKARTLNVPNRVIKQMEHYARTKVEGSLTMDEMDLVAKGRAMDRAQKLLYSYSERRQVFDITRNFFPFGDAWFEVMSTWSRIIKNSHGKPLRRGQQIIEGSINSGFFAENRFGELAFTYPFMGALTSAITGNPVEMEGRVQGLSMFGEIMPGLGPVAQIPAAWFLKDKPELKAMEDFLLPFGAPEGEEITDWKTYAPSWLKTGLSIAGIKTADDKRLYENTVSQYADYLDSTGEYGSSAAEQDRLWQDAKSRANKLYPIRMVAQFFAPAAPSMDFYVEDKSGTRLSAMALSEEFHKKDGDDFETSVKEFVDEYGEDALGALVASSATSVPGFPDSREGQQWIDDNPEIKGNYPLIYALFAPEGKFDFDTYSRQFQGEDRQALSAKQHIAMLSDWKNRYWRSNIMSRMKDENGDPVTSYADMNQAQRNAWEEITVLIDEEYAPARTGIFEKPEIDDMIDQLEDAGTDKDVLATPAGPALARYLELRTEAQALVDQLKEAGAIDSQIKGYTKAKDLRPIREALRSEAQALIDEYPAFEPLWEFVFSRELIRD